MGITADRIEKVKAFYWKKQRMPSYRELMRLLGFKSPRAVSYWVEKWIAEGAIEKDATGRLLPGEWMRPLRLLGDVKAGFPSPAEEEQPDTISLDEWLIERKEASFMLKVSGDSMIDAGIQPGDYVILERGRSPKNGDIVVAEVDREWTMKYFVQTNGKVVLRAANPKYRPILPKQELKVAGVVTAVIRKY